MIDTTVENFFTWFVTFNGKLIWVIQVHKFFAFLSLTPKLQPQDFIQVLSFTLKTCYLVEFHCMNQNLNSNFRLDMLHFENLCIGMVLWFQFQHLFQCHHKVVALLHPYTGRHNKIVHQDKFFQSTYILLEERSLHLLHKLKRQSDMFHNKNSFWSLLNKNAWDAYG